MSDEARRRVPGERNQDRLHAAEEAAAPCAEDDAIPTSGCSSCSPARAPAIDPPGHPRAGHPPTRAGPRRSLRRVWRGTSHRQPSSRPRSHASAPRRAETLRLLALMLHLQGTQPGATGSDGTYIPLTSTEQRDADQRGRPPAVRQQGRTPRPIPARSGRAVGARGATPDRHRLARDPRPLRRAAARDRIDVMRAVALARGEGAGPALAALDRIAADAASRRSCRLLRRERTVLGPAHRSDAVQAYERALG